MCGAHLHANTCDVGGFKNEATSWKVAGEDIDHCVAQSAGRHCKLQFSLYMLIVVVICNLFKCLSMLGMLRQQRKATFVVWGDAMSSWLDNPSRSTEGRCLISRASLNSQSIYLADPQPALHCGRQSRHVFRGISRKRWLVTLCVCIIALGTVAGLLGLALSWMDYTGATLTSLAFGAVDSRTLIDSDMGNLIGPVVVANSPQVVLSAIYLLYNGLFTGMHLAREYSDYEVQRKGLRATTPPGAQHSTCWLQLPFTHSIPSITAFATLHWLISQSIFFVRVSYNRDDQEKRSRA